MTRFRRRMSSLKRVPFIVLCELLFCTFHLDFGRISLPIRFIDGCDFAVRIGNPLIGFGNQFGISASCNSWRSFAFSSHGGKSALDYQRLGVFSRDGQEMFLERRRSA